MHENLSTGYEKVVEEKGELLRYREFEVCLGEVVGRLTIALLAAEIRLPWLANFVGSCGDLA